MKIGKQWSTIIILTLIKRFEAISQRRVLDHEVVAWTVLCSFLGGDCDICVWVARILLLLIESDLWSNESQVHSILQFLDRYIAYIYGARDNFASLSNLDYWWWNGIDTETRDQLFQARKSKHRWMECCGALDSFIELGGRLKGRSYICSTYGNDAIVVATVPSETFQNCTTSVL